MSRAALSRHAPAQEAVHHPMWVPVLGILATRDRAAYCASKGSIHAHTAMASIMRRTTSA